MFIFCNASREKINIKLYIIIYYIIYLLYKQNLKISIFYRHILDYDAYFIFQYPFSQDLYWRFRLKFYSHVFYPFYRYMQCVFNHFTLFFWVADGNTYSVIFCRYQRRAKELSARYKDRPQSPLDTAIYWIEYVARHKGAHFMKTAAVGMPLYQYLLLDVIAFILLTSFLVSFVTYWVCKKLVSLIIQRVTTKKKVEWLYFFAFLCKFTTLVWKSENNIPLFQSELLRWLNKT